jgi:hypothetical protein
MTIHLKKNLQPVFELFDQTLAGTAPDVFGLWATAPLLSAEAIAFDTSTGMTSGIPPEVPVWRVNLPADLNLAAAHLTEGEARLETSQKTIQEAPYRLDAFVRSQSAGLSFDVSLEGREFAKPEAELLGLLGEIQEGRAPVSFGLGEKLVGGWQQATDRFQAFVDQLLKSIAHYAWVETCVQDQCLGRTGVGWTGDTSTVWRQGLSTEQVELHRRTLTLALESRDTLIRTFVFAVQGAVQLSVMLTMPGSALLALPAVWKFINQILKE